jgi:hypothetical protein
MTTLFIENESYKHKMAKEVLKNGLTIAIEMENVVNWEIFILDIIGEKWAVSY